MQDERGNSKTVYFSGMMSWQTVVPCHETDEQEVSMRRKFSVSLERTFSHQVTVTSGCLGKPDWERVWLDLLCVSVVLWREGRGERDRVAGVGTALYALRARLCSRKQP